MKLTETPEVVDWPETHYVFIEAVGPFMESAPKAWQTLHALTAEVEKHNTITRYMSLYKLGPQVYRAGHALAAPPQQLPKELRYEVFPGGKYSRFVMTGPFSDLPAASGRVFEIVEEKKIPQRNGYCIENYVDDPRVTPEDQLRTEILIPTA
jgi:effector-binding domain-containing protein